MQCADKVESSFRKHNFQIEDDIDEFEHLLKEMRVVVEHQRARLDHTLNETLMRESKANLTIAQRSIKENQRNGLCESPFDHDDHTSKL